MTSSSEQPKEYITNSKDIGDIQRFLFDLVTNEDLNYRHDLFEKASDAIKRTLAHPHPAPASIHPKKDCFGKYQGVEDDHCFGCNDWGYCADVTDAVRKAREEYTFADAIETFCYIDIYQYFDETRDIEDVSKCKGKECNYCGKFNEGSSRSTTPQSEQEQPR